MILVYGLLVILCPWWLPAAWVALKQALDSLLFIGCAVFALVVTVALVIPATFAANVYKSVKETLHGNH